MPRMGMGKSTAVRQSSMGGTSSSRLEAFSDGVIAIIITIMALELKGALYGFVLMMCAIAYSILHWSIVRRNGGKQSLVASAAGGGYRSNCRSCSMREASCARSSFAT